MLRPLLISLLFLTLPAKAWQGCKFEDLSKTAVTARTAGRLLQPQDLEAVIALETNPEISKMSGVPASTEKEVRGFFNELLWEHKQPNPRILVYGITLPETGKMVGIVQFSRLNKNEKSAQFAYSLLPSEWNKGLMTEVGKRYIEYAADTLKLDSVWARVDKDNVASKNVLTKLGFQEVGPWYDPVSERTWQRYELRLKKK